MILGLYISVQVTGLLHTPWGLASYATHSPILINGNKGFKSGNGVTSGTGTILDPYILEGWEINASSDRGLEIRNTNAYFIVRNFNIHSGRSVNEGIYTFNVTHGTISNVVIANDRHGVFLDHSSDVTVDQSSISENAIYGLYITNSVNILVSGNSVFQNLSDGIRLTYSTFITIEGNNVYSNVNDGVFMSFTDFSVIRSNSVSDSSDGIQMNFSSNVNVTENTIFSNTSNGVFLNSSPNNTVSGNSLSNHENGIRLSLSNTVSVRDNNVTLSTSAGIRLSSSNNAAISGNTVTSNSVNGIFLYLSNGTNVSGNNVSSQLNGIHLSSSRGTIMSNNILLSSGLSIGGNSVLDFSSHNITPDNLINGKALYYYKDCASRTIDGVPAGQVIIANCTDVQLLNLSITNTHTGVMMAYVSDGLISGSVLSSNILDGVSLVSTSNINISSNIVGQNQGNGIHLTSSASATIIGNNVTSNGSDGIFLSSSNNITMSQNTISANGFGAAGFGIHLSNSPTITTSKNNIQGNRVQASDNKGPENSWDDGYPNGGNFWSDYFGVDNCSGSSQNLCPPSDGIGDTPYNIDGNSKDRYPHLQPLTFRDVAIASIVLARPFAYSNVSSLPVGVNVSVENLGLVSETVTVTLRANGTLAGSGSLLLSPGQNALMIIYLDTLPFPRGTYTISAHASGVPGETNLEDNDIVSDVWFTIRFPGDVDSDCDVDIIDIAMIAFHFDSTSSFPNWDPTLDLDNNNVVNIIDVATAAFYFDQSCA